MLGSFYKNERNRRKIAKKKIMQNWTRKWRTDLTITDKKIEKN